MRSNPKCLATGEWMVVFPRSGSPLANENKQTAKMYITNDSQEHQGQWRKPGRKGGFHLNEILGGSGGRSDLEEPRRHPQRRVGWSILCIKTAGKVGGAEMVSISIVMTFICLHLFLRISHGLQFLTKLLAWISLPINHLLVKMV